MTNAAKFLKVTSRDQCIGCLSCMYACSRMLHAHGGTEKAALRIRSYAGVEGAFSLRVCAGCEEPECVAACPKDAMDVGPGGGARLKKELCIHCRKCVKACKISALQWDLEERIPLPCGQCGHCVKYCPNDVIALEERKSREVPETGVAS